MSLIFKNITKDTKLQSQLPIPTSVDINALAICLTPCILQIQINLCGVEWCIVV